MISQTRTIATARLTSDEQQMLSYALMDGLTPGERREFLYYLDVSDIPQGTDARVQAVVERILGDRLDTPADRGVNLAAEASAVAPDSALDAIDAETVTKTCRHCGATIEDYGDIGWVDVVSGDDGGTYDICPERYDARTDDRNGGHQPA